MPPIKNGLQALCKAIKNYGSDPRIFVASHIPHVSTSPVKRPVVISNFRLQQATRSVCQSMGGVYELSMYEHFISKKGKLMKPTHKYFLDKDTLSTLGCMIFWECMFRESGIKGYWFTQWCLAWEVSMNFRLQHMGTVTQGSVEMIYAVTGRTCTGECLPCRNWNKAWSVFMLEGLTSDSELWK